MEIKIATLQYRYDFPPDFEHYRRKIIHLVEEQAKQGTQLLLFPEYAGLEMLSFANLEKLQDDLPRYLELFQELSQKHAMHICSGTHLPKTKEGTFNRAYLFGPNGKVAFQDKCVLTPYEMNEEILSKGHTLRLFDTALGKIGICVCYDIEFPAFAQELVEKGAQILLVPSYTSSVHGFYRVFLSCRARALENQCYVVQSALVGQTDVEMAYGASSIASPVDDGFPEDGLIALGTRDRVEAVSGVVELGKLEEARAKGQTRNFHDRAVLKERKHSFELLNLR